MIHVLANSLRTMGITCRAEGSTLYLGDGSRIDLLENGHWVWTSHEDDRIRQYETTTALLRRIQECLSV